MNELNLEIQEKIDKLFEDNFEKPYIKVIGNAVTVDGVLTEEELRGLADILSEVS